MSPDAGLETALDQRRRKLDLERQVLAEREIAVQQQAAVLAAAGSRVRMVLSQIEFAQQPAPGIALPVALLGELEQLLRWCEAQVVAQRAHLEALRSEADEARGAVANAHQGVRALELVLEARAAERAEKQRRIEIREADETAARVHAQKVGTR
ncbi:MAG: flagellar FliJ family protein [Chloroflexi bacterium]|nr:flagellar FliJ family protein [Chloroflexota bacterium]